MCMVCTCMHASEYIHCIYYVHTWVKDLHTCTYLYVYMHVHKYHRPTLVEDELHACTYVNACIIIDLCMYVRTNMGQRLIAYVCTCMVRTCMHTRIVLSTNMFSP